MTVPAELVRAVHAAQQQIPAHTPLLTASDQIAKATNQTPGIVMAILQDRYTLSRSAGDSPAPAEPTRK